MRQLRALFIAAALVPVLMPLPASAQNMSPLGDWKTIDDKSGKPRALVHVSETNGELRGVIEKLYLEPNEDPNPKCDKCTDARKNQPIVGITFLSGLKKEEGKAVWSGGEILDPASGDIYKSRISLSDDGKKLNVRGYIGFAFIGRTQVWERAQ